MNWICEIILESCLLFFFPFIFISWRLITLQYCSGFCHTWTWISHGFTCVSHPNPPSQLLTFALSFSVILRFLTPQVTVLHYMTLLNQILEKALLTFLITFFVALVLWGKSVYATWKISNCNSIQVWSFIISRCSWKTQT